jgi:hypothetical protein
LAHVADAAYFIDCLANHSEIEPVGCADVAVEYIARMQTEMDVGDRQALCFAAACEPPSDSPDCNIGSKQLKSTQGRTRNSHPSRANLSQIIR